MREFAGAEPLVGEVRGLRTFRVDDTGALLPLYSDGLWYDGDNIATCAPPTGVHPRGPHPVPSDECECGLYAYGSLAAVHLQRQSRFVLGVVACWGGVVAGTLGVRAEHARVEALWLAPSAPAWLRRRVAVRYPSARLCTDVTAMLAEFPVTELECYEPVRREGRAGPLFLAGCAAAGLALGLVPWELLRSTGVLWQLWLLTTVLAVAATAWLAAGVHWAGHAAAALVMGGVVAWMIAPLFGLGGWLLRVPLLRGGAAVSWAYLVTLWPRYFPVVGSPRQRAFCGVRPSD